MAELTVLRDPKVAEPFHAMTFSTYRRLLNFRPPGPTPVALGAFENGVAVGLALASLGPPANEAKLLSLFVAEPQRGRGIATALARRLEPVCAALGVERLNATFMSGQPATPAIERILAKLGWTAPETRMVVVRCSLDSIKGAPWLNRLSVPPGYEILPWVDITPAERDEIRESNRCDPWIAADLNPFDFESDIEPVTSLALRVHGKVLGWCLNHLIDGTLRYTCSFVRKDLQSRGRVLLLYSEAVNRMPRIGISTGMWTVPVWHEGMLNFARKHMRPYSIFFGETLGVERQIEPGKQ